MIAGVRIGGRPDVLALGVIPLSHRIGRIPELKFFLSVPDELARRIDRASGLLAYSTEALVDLSERIKRITRSPTSSTWH
jgi:hypothetical protein